MHDDGENYGIAFVYSVSFEAVSKEIEVTYEDAEGNALGTENIMPNEQGKLSIKERTFVADGKFYTVAEQEIEATVTKVKAVEDATKIAPQKDLFINNSTAYDGEGAGSNMVMLASGGETAKDNDADGNHTHGNKGNLGSSRVGILEFAKPAEIKDNQLVLLNVYDIKEGTKIYASAYGGATDGSVSSDDIIKGLTEVVWSDVEAKAAEGSQNVNHMYDCKQWLTLDVTDIVKNAEAETVTIAIGAGKAGVYAADTEHAAFGGEFEGQAAYLSVTDGVKVTVDGAAEGALITKNGSKVSGVEFAAKDGDVIRVYKGADYTSGLATIITDGEDATEVTIGEEDVTITVKSNLGVELLDGAQVRIGAAADGSIAEDSGLRFIGVVDKNGTIAGQQGARISVDITAEGSDKVVNIPIELYQDGESTVFTAVLTNLNPDNYNRKFTATPVVTVGEERNEDKNASVTRSIYEVAEGVLVSGSTDEDSSIEGKDYVLDENVKAVLNAYVNAVGVRFGWNENGLAENSSEQYYAFGSDDPEKRTVYFDVAQTAEENGVYTITITPKKNVVIDTQTLLETIRINNNNKKVAAAITDVQVNEDTGVVTFKFNPAKAAE